MNRNSALEKISKLVNAFQHEQTYKMNEAETRLRYIDPFFEALGWDIRNPKEVRIESMLTRTGTTRPDYRFIVDGKTKFFVEAKKPSVKLTDPSPIFQAKSYGFSSKVPLVILIDFEEFRPFKSLARPKYDRPLDGLIKEFDIKYLQYIYLFSSMYDVFSREAVVSGELEKRFPAGKSEIGKTVDKEFLSDLSSWQEELAKNIALRNAGLSVSEINEAVQRILDRIIFLRICEERAIEESEILLSYVQRENIYAGLLKEFSRLRTKYNGLIFNQHALSERLTIDDKLLHHIIVNLYPPRSPYRFNVIPIAILGTIYEQYLGRVITLTPAHRAKIEIKPEVRKAGGIFYTPQFITSYNVKNTVGKIIEGKTPEQIKRLTFIDISCGSGSFVLEMFDCLINYYVEFYTTHPQGIKTIDGIPDVYQTEDGMWHLSTRKKKEILINNIYGVDIDPQAVEVTQMSLYLKLLEGESSESFNKQMMLEFKETILPTLSNNIKCGNSLVGLDIKGLGNNLTIEDEIRIRPFDWETAFPEVMKRGGFDAIVGNPPYIRIQVMKEFSPQEVEYFKSKYDSARTGNYDVYVTFVEKGFNLLRNEGKLGFILPSKFFTTDYGRPLRKLLTEKKALNAIVDFGHHQVFDRATTYTSLLFLSKNSNDEVLYSFVDSPELILTKTFGARSIVIDTFSEEPWLFQTDIEKNLSEKLSKCSTSLGAIPSRIGRGSSSGDDDVFVIIKIGAKYFTRDDEEIELEKEILRVPIYATDFHRYNFDPNSGELIIYPYEVGADNYRIIEEAKLKKDFPKTYQYLLSRKKKLEARKQYQKWYGYSAPRNLDVHENAQFLVPLLADRGLYCRLPVNEKGYCLMASGGFSITINTSSELSPNFVLSLLNSKLLFWRLQKISNIFRGGWITCTKQYVETLPIRTINFNNPDDKQMHDQMVMLVERMLDLHHKKQQARTDNEKEIFDHQIKATDKEIDRLVYKLYDLSAEEIEIVEQFNTIKN